MASPTSPTPCVPKTVGEALSTSKFPVLLGLTRALVWVDLIVNERFPDPLPPQIWTWTFALCTLHANALLVGIGLNTVHSRNPATFEREGG
ncbi:hypothetical protein PM082_018675 [Marasmius tenuissimus]|nr:hypothetical protein PM082_018675 [Marasmius tenuissimus]